MLASEHLGFKATLPGAYGLSFRRAVRSTDHELRDQAGRLRAIGDRIRPSDCANCVRTVLTHGERARICAANPLRQGVVRVLSLALPGCAHHAVRRSHNLWFILRQPAVSQSGTDRRIVPRITRTYPGILDFHRKTSNATAPSAPPVGPDTGSNGSPMIGSSLRARDRPSDASRQRALGLRRPNLGILAGSDASVHCPG